ncbi:hypothetical protein BJY52DRAFT_1223233 [Lactarius psammicola]|nr:hypothetical protein BJY52DRAFT_1223233 [Lactarius psammicola]
MRRIPIFSAYPVRLSVSTTQQVATGEVHPDDGATESTIAPIRSETHRSHETNDRVERRIAVGFLPRQLSRDLISMDGTNDSLPRATSAAGNTHIPFAQTRGDSPPRPLPIGERKRKLSEYGGEAVPRHVKRPNSHVQTGASRESTLPRQAGITGATDTLRKLAEIEDDIRSALIKNEEILAQICDLEARNGQAANRLRDLADVMKKLEDDRSAETAGSSPKGSRNK